MFNNICSTDECDLIIANIDLWLGSIFKTKEDIREKLNPMAFQFIQAEIEGRVSQPALEVLKEKLQNLPVLTLTLSFFPDAKTIEKLSTWVKSNIANQVIIDFQNDSEILGGAQISYNGKYLDDSLKKKLDEYFQNNNQSIKFQVPNNK
jgi:hypothetical protein